MQTIYFPVEGLIGFALAGNIQSAALRAHNELFQSGSSQRLMKIDRPSGYLPLLLRVDYIPWGRRHISQTGQWRVIPVQGDSVEFAALELAKTGQFQTIVAAKGLGAGMLLTTQN